MVNITCRVLSRPDVLELPTIYRTLGADYDERVLPSIVNEVLKSVVAQFNASQLITQRALVSRLVRDQLQARAGKFNIVLDDVSLTQYDSIDAFFSSFPVFFYDPRVISFCVNFKSHLMRTLHHFFPMSFLGAIPFPPLISFPFPPLFLSILTFRISALLHLYEN
jgi:hypothetical protein